MQRIKEKTGEAERIGEYKQLKVLKDWQKN